MANNESNEDGIRWFTVAHGALALLSVIVAYMGRVVIDNSNRLASIETSAAALDSRMDRQTRDLGLRIDHHELEVTHMHDKLQEDYRRVEDRLESQILLLQKASTEAEQRAIQECRAIVSSSPHCAIPLKDKP